MADHTHSASGKTRFPFHETLFKPSRVLEQIAVGTQPKSGVAHLSHS